MNLYIATNNDRKRALSREKPCVDVLAFSRQFSHELLRPKGRLRRLLAREELDALSPDHTDIPGDWRARDPREILTILNRVRERLNRENGRLPVQHLLWAVAEGERQGLGSTTLIVPFGGIEIKVPHDPIVKLDGGHWNPEHRDELQVYDVRVNPAVLPPAAPDGKTRRGIDTGWTFYTPYSAPEHPDVPVDPLIEIQSGWIKVAPELDVLGQRVEVDTLDAVTALCPDLNDAIARCEELAGASQPLYWLYG